MTRLILPLLALVWFCGCAAKDVVSEESSAHPLVHFSNGDKVFYANATDMKADCKGWFSYHCFKIMLGKEEIDRFPSNGVIRVDWIENLVEVRKSGWTITTKKAVKK